MTIRQDMKIIGLPMTLLFLPALIWRYKRGADPVTDHYHRLEVEYKDEVYAHCGVCGDFRYHRQVVWVLPYTETRECPECGTVSEIG